MGWRLWVGVGLAALVGACGALSTDTAAIGDVTYTDDLQPVLQAKCAPCHAGPGFGGVNFAVSYADLFLASQLCPGQRVFQCVQALVRSGSMPPNLGCTGDPAAAGDNPGCFNANELALLAVWVAEGAPE